MFSFSDMVPLSQGVFCDPKCIYNTPKLATYYPITLPGASTRETKSTVLYIYHGVF